MNSRRTLALLLFVVLGITGGIMLAGQASIPSDNKTLAETDCTADKMGSGIPTSSIGEPVAGVTLNMPRWVAATGTAPAYCSIDGAMAPLDAQRPADQFSCRASRIMEPPQRSERRWRIQWIDS